MTAKEIMESENLTSVFKGDKIYKSTKRGVAPLLEILDTGTDVCGYSAADKVIGAGAAYIYVKLRVGSVYGSVISKKAKDIFIKYGIPCSYGKITDYIENRTKTGVCPIENAVSDALSVDDAIDKIRKKLNELA